MLAKLYAWILPIKIGRVHEITLEEALFYMSVIDDYVNKWTTALGVASIRDLERSIGL